MRVRRSATAVTAAAVLAAVLTGAASASPAAGATAVGTTTAAAACSPQWKLVPAPSLPQAGGYLEVESVSALSSGDVWFSGAGGTNEGTLHWNGSSLLAPSAQVPQVPLMAENWGLSQFGAEGSFDSDADGWTLATPANLQVVGEASFDTAEHWHDGQWTMTPLAVSPHPATIGLQFHDIAALSASDAWNVGGFYEAGDGVEAGRYPIGALIEHWDGTSWNIVPNPSSAQPGAVLNSLAVVSASDIWAAGSQTDSAHESTVPLIEHWDGTSWSISPAVPGSGTSGLYSITADSHGDVWAAGYQTEPGTSDVAVPLVERQDGTTWTAQQLPDVGNSELAAIYVAGPSDVWAAGEYAGGLTDMFLRWNGSSWAASRVPGPAEYGLDYNYLTIGGTGPDNIWAAGYTANYPDAEGSALIAHLSCGQGAGA